MATYEVIAGVSRTLRNLLLARMDLAASVAVTVAPPDVDVEFTSDSGMRLNLFLYRVTENAHLRNQEIPGHGHPGAYGHPPLALDLHYLLTVHVSSETDPDADLNAQAALGDGMRVLHDHTTLPSADIPEGDPIVDASLVGEFERIKVSLAPVSLDDLSKIWTALPNAAFRRSAAYQVNVVQIESERQRTYPRPVGPLPDEGPRVYAVPFRSPQIRELRVIRGDDPTGEELPYPYARIGDAGATPSVPGDRLVLYGSNLGAFGTRVLVGGIETGIADRAADRLEIELDEADLADLRAGTQTIQVVQDVVVPDRTDPLAGFRSNVCVFVLVPRIEQVSEAGGVITVEGLRLFDDRAESLVIVGDEIVTSADYTASTPTEIRFARPAGVASGAQPVRVRVNGAESIPTGSVTLP